MRKGSHRRFGVSGAEEVLVVYGILAKEVSKTATRAADCAGQGVGVCCIELRSGCREARSVLIEG
jgi:hypothetical protein